MPGYAPLVFALGRDLKALFVRDERSSLASVLAAEDRLDVVERFDCHVAEFVSFEAYLLVEILGSRVNAARELGRHANSLLRFDHLSGTADRVLLRTLQCHLAREDAHCAVDDAEILHRVGVVFGAAGHRCNTASTQALEVVLVTYHLI